MTEQETQATGETRPAKPEASPQRPAETRVQRRLTAGAFFHRILGDDGLKALNARNWTLTGAALVALGVVSDIMQIFGPIAALGLALSAIAVVVFGAIVFLRLKWRKHCVGHFISAVLAAALFTVVLFFQYAAQAEDYGAIAKHFPGASKIQRAIYARFDTLETGQSEINEKLDRLTREFQRVNPEANLAAGADGFVGTWYLSSPYQPEWVVEYYDNGTYFFKTPTGAVNGVYKAADGLFMSEAPGTGLSDAGSFRFRDDDTLEMTGRFGMSVWKRRKGGEPTTPD